MAGQAHPEEERSFSFTLKGDRALSETISAPMFQKMDAPMFAMMFGDDLVFFAEYDRNYTLTGCIDAIHDAARNAQDELISGEMPEGFENPVVR